MKSTVDKSYINFEKFFKENFKVFKEKDLSESDTRSKILDYLLIEILGWDEVDIEREGFVREGFFDYEIKSSTFKFIIEAKKNFVEFSLPSHKNKVKFKTIYNANKSVIDQVREYLFERGLQFAIITNGHQFIIGQLVNHDGKDWRDNSAIYFNGFDDINSHFPSYYELLSKEYIQKIGRIKIENEKATQKSILNDTDLPFKIDKLNRNKISAKLIPVLSQVFEEIYRTENLENKDILKKCYVENEDIRRYNSELSSIFYDLPPSFDEKIAKVVNTKNTQSSIKKDIFHSNTVYTPDPVILIGTAGAGKTTFIKNFIEFEIDESDRNLRPVVYLDFRGFTSQNVRDTKLIYSKLLELIKENYPELNLHKRNILETIYKKEIKENKEGIWSNLLSNPLLDNKISAFLEEKISNPIFHLEQIARYLNNECTKKLCIVFDNADQLDEDDQKEVFLLANSINSNLKSIVITSLREGYYYRWKDKSPFNAYHSTVYHITAPPYREVLKRRITYVLENFQFDEMDLETDNKKVEFQKGSISHLFKNLYKTLFDNENSEILEFLEETSYPNIRNGLENFQTFLLSGHSKITQYMAYDYGRTGGSIPFWEFLKSVALDSDYYYNSKDSKIVNLFSTEFEGSNHFTKIRILLYLKNLATNEGKNVTFTSIEILISEFSKIGYSPDAILNEVNYLHEKQLIFNSEYTSDIEELIKIDINSHIHISPTGYYYITKLIYQFAYIDLALQSTPIFDESCFAELASKFARSDRNGIRDIFMRVDTAKTFIKYLQKQEFGELNRTTYDNENEAFYKKITKEIVDKTNLEFDRIDRVVPKR